MTKPKILIVEDIDANRDLVVQLLEDSYELIQAVDGLEGVRVAAEIKPALILMDLSLPGIDGWEATRRIKANAELAHIPVIALTAHAMAGERQKALAAGCDDFLTKPIDDTLLETTVGKWIAKTCEGSPAPTSAPAGERPGQVLVVDPQPDKSALIRAQLEQAGFVVRTARSGDEALASASSERPDVIVLDLMMSDMDGLTLCRALRSSQAEAEHMIVFCSDEADAAKIAEALDAGGNDYLTRPYSPIELVARVRAATRMKRAKEALRSHISAVARSVASSREAPVDMWDRQKLFERLEGNKVARIVGPLAAAVLSVDGAENLRAQVGSSAFEALMQEFAGILRRHIQPDDVVSRYGEGDFLVLASGGSVEGAEELVRRLIEAMRQHPTPSGVTKPISVSCGISHSRALPATGAARLVRAADSAMFVAKNNGGGCIWVVHD